MGKLTIALGLVALMACYAGIEKEIMKTDIQRMNIATAKTETIRHQNIIHQTKKFYQLEDGEEKDKTFRKICDYWVVESWKYREYPVVIIENDCVRNLLIK